MFSSLAHQPINLPDYLAPLEELEPFSRVQLIAFDLDGTLLKAPDEAPGERIKRLQGSAKSLGVRITLATGRTLTGAQNTLSALGDLGSTPIILYNGSLVVQPGLKKIIAHRKIEALAANKVIEIARDNDVDLFIYTVSDENAEGCSEIGTWETVSFVGAVPPAREFNGMKVFNLETEYVQLAVTAMLILLKPQSDQVRLNKVLKNLDGISITSSGSRFIELRPKGSSKAAGMTDVIRSLKLSQKDVLAVGDNDNDVELLEWAGIGVSVQGASPMAKSASDYVSRFGAENAAIDVLEIVRRAKRLHRTKR
ncbi:HAD-IIB family hydrolase [Undibacterium amnicola]|uniref:HAD-IIB family hydrolase n=1 Tax=Undibacterium amnicola TaxID=1834038 RepID=A0ABR6XU25_9BURK|nr:HAD-IIB family hydrolase [Undibacterium amnicola]MBC3832417.1 HAD-IIB family hydrolase [Undibacterium amnicola]